MKRLTSLFLVVVMMVSCFATVFVTTAHAAATIISVGKSYSTSATVHTSMPDGNKDLTDGTKSSPNVTANAGGPYVGYASSSPVEIILDLGSAQNSNVFTVYSAAGFWGIAAPKSLAISYSNSASGSFTGSVGSVTSVSVGTGNLVDGTATPTLYKMTFTSSSYINARYIKFTITGGSAYIWLDEIEAAFDSSLPDAEPIEGALQVHNLNTIVATNEISVYSNHDKLLAANPNGWGVYYQLRPNAFANEYSVVATYSNPGTKYANGEWSFEHADGDIYMQVNGGTVNAAVYKLAVGDKLTFVNLNLSAADGDISGVYVYAGTAASKLNGKGQYVLSVDPRSNYSDNYRTKLTDGKKSEKSVGNSECYNAFDLPNGELQIILDLGGSVKTDTYSVYTGKNFYGVNLPKDIKIAYSDNPEGPYTDVEGELVETFVCEGNPYNNGTTDITPQLYKVSLVCEEVVTARYIKYTITPASNNVLWTDEIEATVSAKNGPVISSYTTSVGCRTDVPDEGNDLLDGIKGMKDVAYAGKSYVGYNITGTMDLILDMGAVKTTDSYSLYSAENFWGVWTPKNVTMSISNSLDGVWTYVPSTMTKTKTGDADDYTSSSGTWTPTLHRIDIVPQNAVAARYVKLTITPNGGAVWLEEVEATLAENCSANAKYTVSSDSFHADVRKDDGVKLVDGIASSVNFSGSNYVAWTGVESVDITLNLGKVKSTDTYSVFAPENFWGIWTPETISVAYSDSADGEFTPIEGTFSKIFVGEGNAYKSTDGTYYTAQNYELRLTANEAVDAQYIRITVPAVGTNVWIDEVSASLGAITRPESVPTSTDPTKPNTQCNVHHVDKTAGTGEISVFTSLDKLIASEAGWGMYYQLRYTPNANEFTVVGAVSSPKDNYPNDADADKALFKKYLGFTTPSKWAYPNGDMPMDIYMVAKGATINPSMMHLPIGRTITFTNLTLTQGDYTNTTVMASAKSGTVSGMIDNKITDTNFVHHIANVQIVDPSDLVGVLSAENAPADAFFSGSNLDYNAILKACVQYKVLPTIQIDTEANATALLSAMKATGCHDVNVISASVAVLQKIRSGDTIARTGLIYNINKTTLTSAEANELRKTIRSAPATFVVFDTNKVTKAVVSELQELGVAVWAKSSTATDANGYKVELVNALATGVNGIINTDANAVYDLIDTYFLEDTFTHTPTVVGHRGYPQKATENTMACFIAAYEYGADIIELDVYTTTDNYLVLFHDASFGTDAGKKLTTYTGTLEAGYIRDMTKAQVDQIKYKTGESITYLHEVFEYFKGKDIRIFIEFKGSEYERTVKATANAIKQYGVEDQVCVISSALGYINQVNNYLPGMTSSFVYASTSLTGYAPQNTPEWNYTETSEENLAILSFALNLIQPYNANLSPACGAVSMGYRKDNFMGEATANRGLVLNPWTYGNDWNNNIGFFSKVDSITTDALSWSTNMAKFVTAKDISLVAGQVYNGSGFTATTYVRETYDIDVNDIVYSIVDGDCVEVKDGRLVAVKDGEAKVMLGYKTKTGSNVDYVLYSEVITVTVAGDYNVLKPLIAAAEKMTVNDFNEADLIKLRELHATAVELVNNFSTDEAVIRETAVALSELLDKQFGKKVSDVDIGSYDTTDPNYYKWDSTTGAPSTELEPNYIDDHTRLMDGVKNSPNTTTNAYSVWQSDVDIVVNLGSAVKSNIFNAYFAEHASWGVSAPLGLTISYKDGNGNWIEIDTACTKEKTGDSNGWGLYKYTAIASEAVTAQYIKITVNRKGNFVWMDEVEVQCANGAKVGGDYIYITDFDKTLYNGAAVIYTETPAKSNYRWTNNIVAQWDEFYQAYVVTDVFHGSGDSTPDITLNEGQILIAVHDWESSVTDGTQIVGSARNGNNAAKVEVGQLLVGYGVDVDAKSLGIAPYIRFIDSDHVCESNGEGWISDENGHWHLCACGKKVDEASHTPGTAADCENDQLCTECEYVISEATGHDYKSVVTDPTCTEQGYTTYTCANCDDSYVSDYVDETGHDYKAVVTAPNCTDKGYTTHTCANCGDSYVDSYKDAVGHSYGDWYDVNSNGCVTEGLQRRDCNNCDHYETKSLGATGHDYKAVVTAPTCTAKGYTTHTCANCGDTYVDTYVNAKGHSMSGWTTVTEADCENDGLERRDCDACDYYEENVLPAIGHDYDAVVTAPTCTERGYTTHTCDNCDKVVIDTYVDALGHDYDSVVTEPTCTEQGYTTHTCANCSHSYKDSYENATGHSMSNWANTEDPTCTEDGEARRDCANCDYFETKVVSATGHDYDAVVTEPTCTDRGYTTHTCGNCNDTYVDTYVDAKGHSMGDWTTVTEADCENDGLERRDCDVCDYYEENVLTAIGHKYTSVVTKPTCTERGYTTHTCGNCDDTYVDTYVSATGHDYKAVVTDPTCTEQGYTTHTCANCDDSYVDSYVRANGHSMGDWYEETAPTADDNGLERRDCANCDYYETQEIPALGHNYVGVVTKPTCTEEGYTTYSCDCCGDSYVADKVPALGHDYESTVTDPTCTERGYTTYDCKNCDYSYVDNYVSAIGHDYKAVVTDPTCTEQGYTTHTCANCDDSYVDSYVRANGHSMSDWTTVTEADCENDGLERRDCDVCDYYEENVLTAIGHKYTSVVTEPTCTERGYTTHTCGNCDDTYVDTYVDAMGHSMSNWTTVTEADCENDGLERRDCADCDYYEENVLTAIGHKYTSVVTKPTCTDRGYTTHTCANCDDSYVDTYVSATGHDYKAVVTEPTCTEQGYTTHTCANCSHSYVDSYENATGHSMSNWANTEDPTCTEDGEARRDCANCDYFETKVVPAIGHDYKAVVTKPTCTERGYTTYTCANCDDTYVDDYVKANGHSMGDWTTVTEADCENDGLERRDCDVCDYYEENVLTAIGHKYTSVVTKPTCTERGYTTHACGNCDDTYVDTYVSATGHDYKAVVTEPTCIEQGYTTHTCANCDDTYVDSYVRANGHAMGDWYEETAPTADDNGLERRDCDVCDYYETQEIPALGHNYVGVVTKPTCTEEGYTTYSCDCCGGSYVADKVPALGHDYESTVTDPTCTERGYTTYDCKNCDYSYVDNYVSATGHDYKAVVTDPTCTEQGYTTHTCANCDDSYVDSYVRANGHSMSDWTTVTEADCENDGLERRECDVCDYYEENVLTAIGHKYTSVVTKPTCTERGYTTHTCGNCDYSYVDTYVSATGHDYKAVVTDPTCTEQGYTTHTCANCDDSYVDSYVRANGHSMSNWTTVSEADCENDGLERRDCADCDYYEENVLTAIGHDYKTVVTKPTCTEQGYTTHTCANCDDTYVDTYVDANGHSMSDWTTVTEADCENDGLERRDCADCDYYEENVLTAIGHKYTSVVTKPTCTERGYTTHTCGNCDDTYVDTYVSATGHDYKAVVTKPTCTEQGYTTHTCANCDDSYVDSYVRANGHSMSDWTTVTEADCENDGLERRDCDDCDYYEENVLTAIGHDYKAVVTKPTCTEQGYTTHTCANCDDTYVDTYVDANGHSMSDWATVTEADCENDGLERRDCDNCDHYEENVLPAIGHDYDAVVTAPTCTDRGYTTHTCGNCDDTYVDTYVSATGHDYDSVVTAPTCTEQGYTTHTCANCDDSYVDSYVRANGHSMSDWTTVVAPTCTTDGSIRRDCDACDHYETDVVYKTGHDYKNIVTAPTCEDKGYTTHICNNCGDKYVDSYVDALGHIAGAEAGCENAQTCTACGTTLKEALGHNYEWVVTKEAEVGVEGEKQYICKDCNKVDETVAPEVIPALPEVEDDWMLGDVNDNGKIDMTDYILLKRAYFGTYDFDEGQQKRGDCNQNGKIDMTDYILLKRAYFGTYTLVKK